MMTKMTRRGFLGLAAVIATNGISKLAQNQEETGVIYPDPSIVHAENIYRPSDETEILENGSAARSSEHTLALFVASECGRPCEQMERNFLREARSSAILGLDQKQLQYVIIELEHFSYVATRLGITEVPTICHFTPAGEVIDDRLSGGYTPDNRTRFGELVLNIESNYQ